MESRYTKSQRHQVYKKALALLGQLEKQTKPAFLCRIIEQITKIDFMDVCQHFPELSLFDPGETCWWPMFEYNKRATALMFCIEMTK